MKPEVLEALASNSLERRRRLRAISKIEQKHLLEELIYDFFVEQRRVLLKWSALTGQSAQIDTGYISQHMASVTLAEPGQGFKGKGLDLADGGEVKSAAILSGVDRPRWNHDLGKPDDDVNRESRGLQPKWMTYLEAPEVFYVLFDRAPDETELFRVRAWCVEPERDNGWMDLFQLFVEHRGNSQYNLQLHPPIGRSDDLVVNTLGNLDFSDVKVFEAHFNSTIDPDTFEVDWKLAPSDGYKSGVSAPKPYSRSSDRRISIEGADGHSLPPNDDVRRLFRSFKD
jgi:hypothetical protein